MREGSTSQRRGSGTQTTISVVMVSLMYGQQDQAGMPHQRGGLSRTMTIGLYLMTGEQIRKNFNLRTAGENGRQREMQLEVGYLHRIIR